MYVPMLFDRDTVPLKLEGVTLASSWCFKNGQESNLKITSINLFVHRFTQKV